MPLANFTDIIILLDRSVSMRPIAAATRDGLNEFIESQKVIEGEARVSLVQFSGPLDFRYTFQNLPVKAVEPLTVLTYNPNGSSTAIRDAMGRLIDETGRRYAESPEASRPSKVVFVIMTDGQENDSKVYKEEHIRERIARQQDVYKWQFVYLGANQDAVLEAEKYAINAMSSMTYVAKSENVKYATSSLGDKIGTYRSGLTSSVTFDAQDRKQATEDQ